MESNRLPNIVISIKAEHIAEKHVAKVTSVRVVREESAENSKKNKLKALVVPK